MITKYTTGQAILIPATIRNAEEINGQIIYHVHADTYEGIPEDVIVLNDNAQIQSAMQRFRETLMSNEERSWR